MNLPKIKIREARACIQPVETRMPFRFGIAEMRRMPHLFLRVTLEQGGARATGLAADHLVPKWFTKNPRTTCDEDIREMREVVLEACRVAEDAAGESTPFALWWEIYHEQQRRAKVRGWPPLLASFGASLIERALLDAFCRLGAGGGGGEDRDRERDRHQNRFPPCCARTARASTWDGFTRNCRALLLPTFFHPGHPSACSRVTRLG